MISTLPVPEPSAKRKRINLHPRLTPAVERQDQDAVASKSDDDEEESLAEMTEDQDCRGSESILRSAQSG